MDFVRGCGLFKEIIADWLFGSMHQDSIAARIAGRVRRWMFVNAWGSANTQDIKNAASLEGRIGVGKGTGNHLEIGEGARFAGTIHVEGDSNRIVIGKESHFRGEIIVKGNGQTVFFGDFSTTVEAYILCQEGCDVRIGQWCMLSREVEIRTTDAHAVIDRVTGNRINLPASISIGEHVWIGARSMISKGSKIPSDSIVGAMSFVNAEFQEEGVVIAGVPARVTKRGISWDRSRRSKFTKKRMFQWRTKLTPPKSP